MIYRPIQAVSNLPLAPAYATRPLKPKGIGQKVTMFNYHDHEFRD